MKVGRARLNWVIGHPGGIGGPGGTGQCGTKASHLQSEIFSVRVKEKQRTFR